MLIKNREKRKKYLLQLRDEVKDFLIPFSKKYNRFPWNEVNSVKRIRVLRNTPIIVNGVKFTVSSLITNIDDTKKHLHYKLKVSAFTPIFKLYLKESGRVEDSQIVRIYSTYSNMLKGEFKQMEDDLTFCMNGLNALTTLIRNNKQNIQESEETKMITAEEYLESMCDEIFGYDNNVIGEEEILESYIEALESLAFDGPEFDEVTERAVTDKIDLNFKESRKNYINAIKSCKKSVTGKDFKQAVKDIREAKKCLDDESNMVQHLNPKEIKFYHKLLNKSVKITLALVVYLKASEASDKAVVNDLKIKMDNEATGDTSVISQTITVLMHACDHIENKIGKTGEELKEREKDFKREEKIKVESTKMYAKKRAIYEACQNGEITLAEREALLENIRGDSVFNIVSDSVMEETGLTNGEKFERIRAALYEDANNNVISYDERERLIDKARSILLESDLNTGATTNASNIVNNNNKNNSDVNKASKELDKAIDNLEKSNNVSGNNVQGTNNTSNTNNNNNNM